MDEWYKLDNAAKMFPAVKSAKNSSVFRISVVLKDKVDEYVLQKAVDKIYSRFPMLFVRVRHGVFWNYLDSNSEKFLVKEESDYPCKSIDYRANNGYFLQILYYNNRISIEVFHSLTDGFGAIELLKSVVYYYLLYSGKDVCDEGKILLFDERVKESETEDSFSVYYEKSHNARQKDADSYRITGTNYELYGNNVVIGVMSAQKLNLISKSYNTTITGYVTALLIHSIFDVKIKKTKSKKPVVITVPANLRKLFPSETLRNFFGVVNIGVIENMPLEDLINEVTKQLKEKVTKENMSQIVSANIKLEKNFFSRITPLFIKNLLVGMGANMLGEKKKTLTLSNVGKIDMPKSFEKYILYPEVVLYPTAKSPINCGMTTLGDNLIISFAKTIRENDIIRCFYKYLAEKEKLEISVYSNEWGDKT